MLDLELNFQFLGASKAFPHWPDLFILSWQAANFLEQLKDLQPELIFKKFIPVVNMLKSCYLHASKL